MERAVPSALAIIVMIIGIIATRRLGRDSFNVTSQRHVDRIFRRLQRVQQNLLLMTVIADVVLFGFLAYDFVSIWKFSIALACAISLILIVANFADGWVTTASQSAFWRFGDERYWANRWAYHFAVTVDVVALMLVGYLFILALL